MKSAEELGRLIGAKVAPPRTVDEYANQLKTMRPTGPTESLAEGSRALDEGTQGLIEQQAAKGLLGDDTSDRMAGVAGSDMGLVRAGSADSMGMALPEDFDESLTRRSNDAVSGTVERIRKADEFLRPMRQGGQQAQAAANFAKSENLRFNNWALKNQQHLQKLQIEMMKRAQEKSFLSTLLGLTVALPSAVAGGILAGPAGAAAGAGMGFGFGSGVGGT